MTGLSPLRMGSPACSTMPMQQLTALAMSRRVMMFIPVQSQMVGMATMSFSPTTSWNCLVPLATVVAITLGKPMGSTDMAEVAMVVFCRPPTDTMPWILPALYSLSR